jgi:uncharacterized protein
VNILVSGASGLIGSALVPLLQTAGHTVSILVRSTPNNTGAVKQIGWNPDAGQLDATALEGFDAVVHLAGENIAGGRWTPEQKHKIKESRIKGTTLLAETLAKLSQKPEVLVSASAIGYYGNRGDVLQTETSTGATDYLGLVCRNWENATEAAREAGIRVVNSRFGIVMSPKGGALAKMLPPFLIGAGGPLGNGKQTMSWVALDDVVGALLHCITNQSVRGPVNVVSPNPVTNAQFSKVLGQTLFRPWFAPVPSLAVKLLFGEMGDALLLSSTKVAPVVLQETGYQFRYPQLDGALKHVLGK